MRCGAVRCGAVRCGAVRCGAVRCGAVRCGAAFVCPLPMQHVEHINRRGKGVQGGMGLGGTTMSGMHACMHACRAMTGPILSMKARTAGPVPKIWTDTSA